MRVCEAHDGRGTEARENGRPNVQSDGAAGNAGPWVNFVGEAVAGLKRELQRAWLLAWEAEWGLRLRGVGGCGCGKTQTRL